MPCYVKQLGREAQESDAHQPCVKWGLDLADRKGADPEEWPEDLHKLLDVAHAVEAWLSGDKAIQLAAIVAKLRETQ